MFTIKKQLVQLLVIMKTQGPIAAKCIKFFISEILFLHERKPVPNLNKYFSYWLQPFLSHVQYDGKIKITWTF